MKYSQSNALPGKLLNLAILIYCSFLGAFAQAEVVGYIELGPKDGLKPIRSIVDWAGHKFEVAGGDILTVFDWDNTITKRNGINFPRKSVKSLMEYLVQQKIPSVVLTARYGGSKAPKEKNMKESLTTLSQDMMDELSALLGGSSKNAFIQSPFFNLQQAPKLVEIETAESVFYLMNNIMFAGHKKGEGLITLLDDKNLNKNFKPKFIIVMDDVRANLLSIGMSFDSHRPESVLLVHVYNSETANRSDNTGKNIISGLAKYPHGVSLFPSDSSISLETSGAVSAPAVLDDSPNSSDRKRKDPPQ